MRTMRNTEDLLPGRQRVGEVYESGPVFLVGKSPKAPAVRSFSTRRRIGPCPVNHSFVAGANGSQGVVLVVVGNPSSRSDSVLRPFFGPPGSLPVARGSSLRM